MNLVSLYLSDIDADPLFKTHFARDLRPLQASLKTFGVLNPVRVRQSPTGRFQLVDGFLRTQVAQELEIQSIPALVYTETELSLSDAFLLALEINRLQSPFNAVERAILLREAIQIFGVQGIPKIF